KVALSKLNPFVTHGPLIGPGSVLYGLRGSSFTTTVCTPDDLPLKQCRGAVRDQTRGGASFTFPGVAEVGGARDSAPLASVLLAPAPTPTPDRTAVKFRVGRPGFVELAVFDVNGRRVRTIQAGTIAPGVYTREWDGQTDHFSAAPNGLYFVVLHTADGRL